MYSTLNPTEPMIMVHRGWQNTTKEYNHPAPPSSQNSVRNRRNTEPNVAAPQPPQTFEFVNVGTTTSGQDKDPKLRKLVRAHVVKDWSRRKKHQRLQLEKQKGRRIESVAQQETRDQSQLSQPYLAVHESAHANGKAIAGPSHAYLPSPPIGPVRDMYEDSSEEMRVAASLLEAPGELDLQGVYFTRLRKLLLPELDPDPYLSPIVYHIRTMGTAMFPLATTFKFNPLCPNGCVGWSLNDKAVCHGILYSTSSYANLISGVSESKESIMHVSKTVEMVNKRLKEINEAGNGSGVDEGIIGAVASIALTEALRGNLESWKIHMSGVKHLVGVNGGISRLSTHLRFKLYRADLQGAIGFLATLFFSGSDAPNQLFTHGKTYSEPWSPNNSNLLQLLTPLAISQDLTNALFSMSDLSDSITEVISTRAECSVSQQAIILDQTYSIQYSLLRPWSKKQREPLKPMEDLLRVAGLLYMHATWQDFPFAAVGFTKLIIKLKELVVLVEAQNETEESLIVWMLFMGAISAAGKGDSRIWFIAQLQRSTDELDLDSWDVVRGKLEGLWWVEKIHGKLCRAVWDEVVVLNTVLTGDYFH